MDRVRNGEVGMGNEELNRGQPSRQRDAKGRFVKGVSGNPGGRPVLPPEFRKYGRESVTRLRAIADDPETPAKLRADIERFFFEAVYGKASALADRESREDGAVQSIRFEGVLEQWSE